MSVFNYKQRNNIILTIIILLGIFLIWSLKGLLSAILGAIVLYTIFRSLYLKMITQWRWKKVAASLTIIFSSFIIIIIPFLVLSVLTINKISKIKYDAHYLERAINKINKIAGIDVQNSQYVDDIVNKASNSAAGLFPTIIGGAFGIFLTITVMYFILFFMFTQHDKFEQSLLKYAPFNPGNAIKFGTELRNTTYSNVLGQGVIALIQGIIVGILFFATGIKDPIFWAVISTFLSFLPVVGAPIVTVPVGIMQLVNGNTWQGVLILAVTFVIIINIDNVIRFMINKRVADTHPIITVIGVIIGIPTFGILGLVFGPLLLSYFVLLVQIYESSLAATDRFERMHNGETELKE